MKTEDKTQELVHRVVAHSQTVGSKHHFMLALALCGGSATFSDLAEHGLARRTAGRLAVVLSETGEVSVDIDGAPNPTRITMELQCPTDCKGYGA